MTVMHSSKKRRDLIAATVSEVEDLAPRVRRVRFAGSSLVGIDWKPGQKIKIEAGNKMRSYTPARVDTKAGWMDVVFFLHGNGPASLWASSVSVGHPARFKRPVKSMRSAKKTPDWGMKPPLAWLQPCWKICLKRFRWSAPLRSMRWTRRP
ncbi:MAG: siderophore-interacting protein [Myxococcota bacterium]